MKQKEPQQRKKFTPEEDKTLVQWYYDHQNRGKGIGIFQGIQTKLPGRTARQCRQRFKEYLNPMVSHTPFSREELGKLVELVEKYGRRWASLQKCFPNRSPTALKNAYNKECGNKSVQPTFVPLYRVPEPFSNISNSTHGYPLEGTDDQQSIAQMIPKEHEESDPKDQSQNNSQEPLSLFGDEYEFCLGIDNMSSHGCPENPFDDFLENYPYSWE